MGDYGTDAVRLFSFATNNLLETALQIEIVVSIHQHIR